MADATQSDRRRLGGVRARVTLGSLLLLAAGLAASVVVARQALLVRVYEAIERDMAQEIEELRSLVSGVDPETGEAFGDDVEAILSTFLRRNVPASDEAFYAFVGGRPFLTSFAAPEGVFADQQLLDRWTSATVPTRASARTSDGDLRSLAVPLVGTDGQVLGTFVVVVYPAEDLAEVAAVVRTLILVAFVVAVIGAVAAWSLAGRMLRPVRELTEAARTTGASDLSRRIPVTGDDEIADLARTFNDMLDRLDGAFTSQRAFLDDVAHELRTPITIVRGHLELLGDDPRERAETVALVTDELDRMSRYVNDLLLVAKAAQPDFLHAELVDVADILDAVLARAPALGDREWDQLTAPQPGSLLTVADPDRLTQALLALVSNAVQHTRDGDRIGIGGDSYLDDGRHILRLWVTDTGPGLAPDEQRTVFTRFSRGATSALQRPDGTGLGLAIVSAIARAHGGTVDVVSPPGSGATFCISIPQQLESEPRA